VTSSSSSFWLGRATNCRAGNALHSQVCCHLPCAVISDLHHFQAKNLEVPFSL
jgi:hypothetical protein